MLTRRTDNQIKNRFGGKTDAGPKAAAEQPSTELLPTNTPQEALSAQEELPEHSFDEFDRFTAMLPECDGDLGSIVDSDWVAMLHGPEMPNAPEIATDSVPPVEKQIDVHAYETLSLDILDSERVSSGGGIYVHKGTLSSVRAAAESSTSDSLRKRATPLGLAKAATQRLPCFVRSTIASTFPPSCRRQLLSRPPVCSLPETKEASGVRDGESDRVCCRGVGNSSSKPNACDSRSALSLISSSRRWHRS